MWPTDKFYAICAAAGLLLSLGFLAQQEIKLRHELSTVNRSLDSEIQCRVGSTCAQKLSDEAARGAALVVQERAKALAEAAAQKAALEQQAVDAVRQLSAAQAQAQKEALTWKQKYQNALLTPTCADWAKERVVCDIH